MDDITQNFADGAATIGEAIGFDPIGSSAAAPRPLLPPRLATTPAFPEPGIYFDMDEDVYHAIPACSQSGMKKLGSSPMLFWATSWMNPKRPTSESRFKNLGKAYHCRVMEPHCYMQRFARALVPDDVVSGTSRPILVSTDDIKGALADLGVAAPSKLGTGVFVPAPTKADPDKKKENTRSVVKADLVAMLLELDPDAMIWDQVVADYQAEHAGKILIDGEEADRVEIAARMIELDEELKDAFTGGHAEVSIFWFCARTGAPMKARMDYLKARAIVDLKSFSNPLELTIDRAIGRAMANGKYPVQVVNYLEAVEAAKAMIRQRGASAIAINPFLPAATRDATLEWAMRWAKVEERPEFLYVFQQTGIAPVTRGVWFPIGGTTYTIAKDAVERLKRKFVECAQAFGTDPWLDVAPTYTIPDEEIPSYATDL
jgi:hypothetical protein